MEPAEARNLKIAADQGNSDSQWRYGACLEFGKGLSTNVPEAAKYYKLSTDQNNSDGQRYYVRFLEKGKGLPRELGEATVRDRTSREWAAEAPGLEGTEPL
jgi:TPR repeat protein